MITVIVFIALAPTLQQRLDPEVFKLTFQFLLVVVLGSGVSALFQAVAFARDARDRERALQREIHQGIVSAYNQAKRSRRLLRARARTGTDDQECSELNAIAFATYDKYLESLSDAQLGIELAVRRIEVNRTLFSSPEALVTSLKRVETYLMEVIDEWEETCRKTKNERAQMAFAELPALNNFLRHYDPEGPFHERFKEPFRAAMQLLERDIKAV